MQPENVPLNLIFKIETQGKNDQDDSVTSSFLKSEDNTDKSAGFLAAERLKQLATGSDRTVLTPKFIHSNKVIWC